MKRYFERIATVKVRKDGSVPIPVDLGILLEASYVSRNLRWLAAVEEMSKDRIRFNFFRDAPPPLLEIKYFDANFCERNRAFMHLSSTPLNDNLLMKFAKMPDPYSYYTQVFKPLEPKLAQQDFYAAMGMLKYLA